jgi:hypothetical protein
MSLEESFQKMVVDGLRTFLPKTWLVCHAANGGYRTPAEAGIMKAMGVVAGFPDLMILGEADWGAAAWFLELKVGDKEPSQVQLDCHINLRDLGFSVEVVRSWPEVLVVARRWNWPMKLKGWSH